MRGVTMLGLSLLPSHRSRYREIRPQAAARRAKGLEHQRLKQEKEHGRMIALPHGLRQLVERMEAEWS